jgi:pimeloyl-ACP methyl ester carboxylesterase
VRIPSRFRLVGGALTAMLLVGTVLSPGVSAGAEVLTLRVNPPAGTAGHVETHTCLRHICGTVLVPLDWATPTDMTNAMTVHFEIAPHTGKGPTLEPIVAFEGGPGYGSIYSGYDYSFMLGRLRKHRDLILMDQRGTGKSNTIDCEALQNDPAMGQEYLDAVQDCINQLGPQVGAFGTAASADDLAAILTALDIPQVDVYGDSYGTYIAQVFTIRHPGMVRATVLDGTYDDQFDSFARDAARAVKSSFEKACARSSTCPNVLQNLTTVAGMLKANPLVGDGYNAAGRKFHLTVTDRDLAQMSYDAAYVFTMYDDLPAALDSYLAGDNVPLLRLAAEDLPSTSNGNNPVAYSAGAYVAISCTDYPVLWDTAQDIAGRQAQLDNEIANLQPGAFAPFDNDTWLNSIYEFQLVFGCLPWPEPAALAPTLAPHPNTPVLVLNGDMDITTPFENATQAANAWPNSTLVEVSNEIHVSALYDFNQCGSVIARNFIRTLDAGDTSCAAEMVPIHVKQAFPMTLQDAPQGTSKGGDQSTALDRQAAWVASETVGDSYTRWWSTLSGNTGVGLRGGTYDVGPGYWESWTPLALTYHHTKFVKNMSISGTSKWNKRNEYVVATIHVSGPVEGDLVIEFSLDTGDLAQVHGTLNGHRIHVTTPVPFSP